MCRTQNVLGIDETERVPSGAVYEADSVKSSHLPARLVSAVELVEPYPQDINFLGLVPQTWVHDTDSKYSQDAGIFVRVSVSLGKSHDVGVGPGIQRLRFTSAIVGCIVDSHRIVEVELVLDDDQLRTLFIRE